MLASVRGDCKLQWVLGSETIPLNSPQTYRNPHDYSVTGITPMRRYRSDQSEECPFRGSKGDIPAPGPGSGHHSVFGQGRLRANNRFLKILFDHLIGACQ
jgi:hypothetical protein